MTSPSRPERRIPSQAWSTTVPTASSSLRQGITTEISTGDDIGTLTSMIARRDAAGAEDRIPYACRARGGAAMSWEPAGFLLR